MKIIHYSKSTTQRRHSTTGFSPFPKPFHPSVNHKGFHTATSAHNRIKQSKTEPFTVCFCKTYYPFRTLNSAIHAKKRKQTEYRGCIFLFDYPCNLTQNAIQSDAKHALICVRLHHNLTQIAKLFI